MMIHVDLIVVTSELSQFLLVAGKKWKQENLKFSLTEEDFSVVETMSNKSKTTILSINPGRTLRRLINIPGFYGIKYGNSMLPLNNWKKYENNSKEY